VATAFIGNDCVKSIKMVTSTVFQTQQDFISLYSVSLIDAGKT